MQSTIYGVSPSVAMEPVVDGFHPAKIFGTISGGQWSWVL
jgi:hypothetical protein